jgi:hypothetical protein
MFRRLLDGVTLATVSVLIIAAGTAAVAADTTPSEATHPSAD